MRGKIRKGIAFVLSAVLGVATIITTVPQLSVPVFAAGTGKNLQLGYAAIGEGFNTSSAAKVYFGSPENKDPLAWRVIGYNGNGTASTSGNATLLSSDLIGSNIKFADTSDNQYNNGTSPSNLYTAIAGNNDSILAIRFTDKEKADSVMLKRLLRGREDQSEAYGSGNSDYIRGSDLADQKLWPLSTAEATTVASEIRCINDSWWLRSPGSNGNYAARVDNYGDVDFTGGYVNSNGGVRPAFNLNLSSIIFTSDAADIKSSGAAGTLNAPGDHSTTEWKLTVKDDGLTVAKNGSVTRTGTTIKVPYTVTVAAATSSYDRVSVFISDKEWNAEGAVLKYYGELETSAADGTGSFTLPGDYDPSWKVYILAEKINGDTQTDYASAPVKITIPAVSVVLVDNDAAPNIIGAYGGASIL